MPVVKDGVVFDWATMEVMTNEEFVQATLEALHTPDSEHNTYKHNVLTDKRKWTPMGKEEFYEKFALRYAKLLLKLAPQCKCWDCEKLVVEGTDPFIKSHMRGLQINTRTI